MCKIVKDYAKQYAKEYAKEYGADQKREGKIEAVKNMVKEGLTLETALRYAGLDAQTYRKYADEQ